MIIRFLSEAFGTTNTRGACFGWNSEKSENWPFRGLFWLSKDLFEEEFRGVTEPDAQALYEIRNHLEHKYLKVHEMMRSQPADSAWTDRLAYSVERQDFVAKTLRVLRLSRAG